MCPTPGIATVCAPSASASGGPFEAPRRSCSPQHTSAGASTRRASDRRSRPSSGAIDLLDDPRGALAPRSICRAMEGSSVVQPRHGDERLEHQRPHDPGRKATHSHSGRHASSARPSGISAAGDLHIQRRTADRRDRHHGGHRALRRPVHGHRGAERVAGHDRPRDAHRLTGFGQQVGTAPQVERPQRVGRAVPGQVDEHHRMAGRQPAGERAPVGRACPAVRGAAPAAAQSPCSPA